VLLAALLMTVLGFPGLDRYDADTYTAPDRRAAARQTGIGRLEVAAADLNRRVRLPVVAWLEPLQRPLRVSQNWHLYGHALVHRTHDPGADWLGPLLRYRKVRPILGAICDDTSRNDRPMLAWLVRRAQQDFPGCTRVTLRCTSAPYPGTGPEMVDLTWKATAPNWKIR
jgi:hypothetical protein